MHWPLFHKRQIFGRVDFCLVERPDGRVKVGENAVGCLYRAQSSALWSNSLQREHSKGGGSVPRQKEEWRDGSRLAQLRNGLAAAFWQKIRS